MSRGPGKIERVVEQTLRETDRSFTVEELAKIAYRGINLVEKKHRVSILRAVYKVSERLPLWFFDTYTPPWRLIVTNRFNVRSYAHGLLRWSWWNAERSLEQIEEILADSEIQSVMEPGGFWWAQVEINKIQTELNAHWEALEAKGLVERDGGVRSCQISDQSPEMIAAREQLDAVHGYERGLAGDFSLHTLLGKFEPPTSHVFQYAMAHRASEPVA